MGGEKRLRLMVLQRDMVGWPHHRTLILIGLSKRGTLFASCFISYEPRPIQSCYQQCRPEPMSCHGFYNRVRTQREYRLLKPKEPVNIPLFAVMAHNASMGHRGWMVIVLPQTRTHTIWCGNIFPYSLFAPGFIFIDLI